MLKKGKEADKPVSVSNIPPPILAKSPKKVIKISKFFKKNMNNKGKKSYAQVLSSSSNVARETFKIKEIFLNLQKKLKISKKLLAVRPRANQN